MKNFRPDITVVLMGDHVTAFPEESLEKSPVDYVMTGGNFDLSLLSLVNHISKKEKMCGGIYYREGNKIQHSGEFQQEGVFHDFPKIDRDLTHWKQYSLHNGNYKYLPGTYTMIGRDCWWRKDGGCTFCSWTGIFPKFQMGSAEHLLNEIDELVHRYGVREIFDDTGTFPGGKVLQEFCEGLMKRGLHQKVVMGCNMKPGAEPHVTCMVGYPWETKHDALETIRLTKDLFQKGWIDTLQATIVIPYPGTELFRQAQENDWLLTTDWDDYDMRKQVLKGPLTSEDVRRLSQGLYKS